MARCKISSIYSAVQKAGGKRPIIERPSDEPKQARKTDIIDQGDVYTKDGMLRAVKIHKGEYGCFIRLGGHEIKVVNTHNVWHQKGIELHDCPMVYHAREVASIDPTPVKIYSDFTRLDKKTHYKNSDGDLIRIHPSRQKNLTGEVRNLVPVQTISNAPRKGI